MRGPVPKPAAMRQRKGRESTRALLPTAEQAATRPVPDLPERDKKTEKWHPLVLRWWKAVWKSPMAEEYLESDKDDLFLLAELRQDFYAATDASERQKIAAEIRQQSVRFGLSPIDRRRLQWEVERGDQASERVEQRRKAKATDKQRAGKDPREILRAI